MLFFLSFLSKQVPASYVILSQGVILIYIFIKMKKIDSLRIIFFSTIFFILFLIFILTLLKIDLNSFYIQYFDYPRSIGLDRYSNFQNHLKFFFNQYKFLLLPIILILFLKFKKMSNKQINFLSKEVIIFFDNIFFESVFYSTN